MANATVMRIVEDYGEEVAVAIMDNMPIGKRFKTTDCLECVKHKVVFVHVVSDKILQQVIGKVLNSFEDLTRIGNMYIWIHNEE